MEINAKITILGSKEGVTIEVRNDDASIVFLKIFMTPEAFLQAAMGRLACSECKAEVFDLDKVFYAGELKESNWKINLPLKDIKRKVMLVFLDIYGNESRRVIEQKQSTSKARRANKK